MITALGSIERWCQRCQLTLHVVTGITLGTVPEARPLIIIENGECVVRQLPTKLEMEREAKRAARRARCPACGAFLAPMPGEEPVS